MIRLSSVLAAEPPPEQLSWLMPISEDLDDLLSESTDRLQGITEQIEKGGRMGSRQWQVVRPKDAHLP